MRFSDGLNHTSTNNGFHVLHVPAFAINGKYTGLSEYVHPYYENDNGVRDDFHIDVRATTGIGYINIYRSVLSKCHENGQNSIESRLNSL